MTTELINLQEAYISADLSQYAYCGKTNYPKI